MFSKERWADAHFFFAEKIVTGLKKCDGGSDFFGVLRVTHGALSCVGWTQSNTQMKIAAPDSENGCAVARND